MLCADLRDNDMRNKRIKTNLSPQALFSEDVSSLADIVDCSPYGLAHKFIEPATDESPVADIARNSKSLLRQVFRGKGA